MSDYKRPAPRTYEITWRSGHIETVQAQQVSYPDNLRQFGPFGGNDRPERIAFHCEVDGTWSLILQADQADIRTVRDVTVPEQVQP